MPTEQIKEVKSRPMLYSGPMVRAILDRKKTKTRRIAKLPLPSSATCPMSVKCPYGVVGDRLWIRETWQSLAAMNQCHPSDDQYVYRATDPDWERMKGWQWRPSIFMPRDACRINLRIESIVVERLHSITDAEIVFEGFRGIGEGVGELDGEFSTLRGLFSGLWNKINGPGSWEANPFVWVVGFSVVPSE